MPIYMCIYIYIYRYNLSHLECKCRRIGVMVQLYTWHYWAALGMTSGTWSHL